MTAVGSINANAPSRRHSPGRTVVVLAVAALGALIFQASLLSFSVNPRARVPLHAQEVLDKCRALTLKPGPPSTFNNRSGSDRFQAGTRPVYIHDATIWTGRLQGLEVIRGGILIDRGLIKAVGHVPHSILPSRDDLVYIDAKGAWVTPGLVDMHSHLGAMSSPLLNGADDVNSEKGPIVPWLRSLDALNTHDEGYEHSMAGGVTTSLILPGSGNAIGGQAFVIKLRPTQERSPSAMLLEPPFGFNGSDVDSGTPPRWRHMKHACGENPAGSYGDTRMDTTWAYRHAYDTARKIKTAQDDYCSKATVGDWQSLAGREFPEELQWESVVDLLRGRVHTHCYEALDFDNFIRMSNEFQFPVAAFHHASEAYLVPDVLKRAYGNTPAIATFATFGRAKREFYRQSEFAPRILAEHDIPVIMKSDHPALFARYLMHDAAQAHYFGLSENIALASVMSTPAEVLGLDHRIGFIKDGYDADLVIWDSHPLSLGATPAQVIIDGILQFPAPYAVAKPPSHQAAPHTPDFTREAAETVEHEGLPPLAPRLSTAGTVVFTGVADVWARTTNISSEPITNTLADMPLASSSSPAGASSPGLTVFTSSLGLEEIVLEPSTRDGPVLDPLAHTPPSVAGGAGYLPRALDGLQFASRTALLAYRSGVTTGVSAPIRGPYAFLGGLSAAFALGAPHKLARGAVVQQVAALHVALQRGGAASVGTQVAALRRYLSAPRGRGGAVGSVPLVVEVHSADIIATLLVLKREVEERSGVPLRLTLSGATEAHLLAKELCEAGVGVIVMTPRPYPLTWDQRRLLAGPPLTEESAIARLIKHNVTALGESPDVLTKSAAFALVTSNVEKLLGVEVGPGEGDIVVTSGGDLLGFEGKVVAVISPRRGAVDLF
ncbi:hypothetical protein B0H21DRAFT_848524 [Amylocystis lapponica]|nr:hypothetical protein B0H21DRAFT_848524 [Amylocystis lapponica]